jgi:hypothetical protein
MGATSGFNAGYTLLLQSIVLNKKLGIFFGVYIIGHYRNR